jgi:hypothetical protein
LRIGSSKTAHKNPFPNKTNGGGLRRRGSRVGNIDLFLRRNGVVHTDSEASPPPFEVPPFISSKSEKTINLQKQVAHPSPQINLCSIKMRQTGFKFRTWGGKRRGGAGSPKACAPA